MKAMTDPEIVRGQLEIERGSEPIRGHLSAAGAGRYRFRGWLALFAAVEQLRAGREPGADPLPDHGRTTT
jgi:hypothetical protein